MATPNSLGQRLRMVREARGLTAADLGAMVSLGGTTITRYEQGIRDPDTETLVRLAEILDVSLDYLFGLTAKPGYSGKRLYLKDHLAHFPPDVRDWVVGEANAAYVLIAKEAADGGLDAKALKSIVETIRHELIRAKKP
jgi:transcriptional regulator with XRE-family HTH domain